MHNTKPIALAEVLRSTSQVSRPRSHVSGCTSQVLEVGTWTYQGIVVRITELSFKCSENMQNGGYEPI